MLEHIKINIKLFIHKTKINMKIYVTIHAKKKNKFNGIIFYNY